MQYGRIIRRAWHLAWRKRTLWFFGIAVALFSVNLSRLRDLGGWHLDMSGLILPPWLGPLSPAPGPALFQPAFFLALTTVGSVVLLISLLVRLTGQGALIGMVDDIEQRDQTSLGVGLRAGWRNLLRLVVLDLLFLLAAVIFVALLALIVALFALVGGLPMRILGNANMGPNAGSVGGLWGAFVVLLAGAAILVFSLAATALATIVREMAQRAIVLDHQWVLGALRSALGLLKARLGQLGLMWMLLFSIYLAFSLITMPLTLFGGMALALPFDFITKGSAPSLLGLLLAIPLLLVIVVASLFLNGIYLAFRSAVWTLTYREVAEPLAELD